MPFANPLERATHFVRHGAEFGCATEAEYELLAEQFLFGPMDIAHEAMRASQGERPASIQSNRIGISGWLA